MLAALRKFAARLHHDSCGASAMEYGLLAGLLSIAIITSLSAIGVSLGGFFDFTALSLSQHVPG